MPRRAQARAIHESCRREASLYGRGGNFDGESSHVILVLICKFVDARRSGFREVLEGIDSAASGVLGRGTLDWRVP